MFPFHLVPLSQHKINDYSLFNSQRVSSCALYGGIFELYSLLYLFTDLFLMLYKPLRIPSIMNIVSIFNMSHTLPPITDSPIPYYFQSLYLSYSLCASPAACYLQNFSCCQFKFIHHKLAYCVQTQVSLQIHLLYSPQHMKATLCPSWMCLANQIVWAGFM